MVETTINLGDPKSKATVRAGTNRIIARETNSAMLIFGDSGFSQLVKRPGGVVFIERTI
jgi:hypothetical protein